MSAVYHSARITDILALMGIWGRLGTVIKSYINTGDTKVFGKNASRGHSDPDLDAAYEELDEFLKGKPQSGDTGAKAGKEQRTRPVTPDTPAEIQRDFAELGLTPDASKKECREAYKRILKIHHPDRHSKQNDKLKAATEKTAQVNAAYERLNTWFRLQSLR